MDEASKIVAPKKEKSKCWQDLLSEKLQGSKDDDKWSSTRL